MMHPAFRSLTGRLMCLFALLLLIFMLILGLFYNTFMERQMISHYSKTMQRNAYAIAQSLSEMIAPSPFKTLDENPFVVGEDTLSPYMALIEHITSCNVYLIDAQHNVTGYFNGVEQQKVRPLLPGYIEQTIALGFMGKTPFIQSKVDGELHLTACMPIMNAESRVLGVVLLESTLRELGFAQIPSSTVLLLSGCIALAFALLLSFFFSHAFTRPISSVQKVAGALAGGDYLARTQLNSRDEIGLLARSMDILAERLQEARQRDELLHRQQQEFFSNISHELRTPVTVIRGSLEALRDGVVANETDIRSYYDQMLAESRWLQRLIQDLLELSRLQSAGFVLEKGDVDLCELLGDVAMSAHALCESKGVRLICDEPQAHFVISGDYARLRQMLIAVLDNAVKFTAPGRSVSIQLRADDPAIIISDEGVGIAPEEIPHIFDRFRHTHDSTRDSTGLGLAIVNEIARRHEIRIDVSSRLGEGTRFTFVFSGHIEHKQD